MGKGDKKSRRGKIHIGSYGTRRPRKQGNSVPTEAAPKAKVKAPRAESTAPKKVKKVEEPVVAAEVETAAATEVKKAPRKTTKKAKEEPAAE